MQDQFIALIVVLIAYVRSVVAEVDQALLVGGEVDALDSVVAVEVVKVTDKTDTDVWNGEEVVKDLDDIATDLIEAKSHTCSIVE